MGINICVSNLKAGDDARVLNNVSIQDARDVNLEVRDLEINGRAVILENLKIEPLMEELNARVWKMDKNSDEYFQIQEILKVKDWNKKKFIGCIGRHLNEFSQGVLASVVANILTQV